MTDKRKSIAAVRCRQNERMHEMTASKSDDIKAALRQLTYLFSDDIQISSSTR